MAAAEVGLMGVTFRAKIRGRIWRLLFVTRDELHKHIAREVARTGEVVERLEGLTDHPDYKRRAMRILETLRGRRRLETLVHEALHAAMWDVAEDAVRDTARDITRLLWRLGYRQNPS